MDPMKPLSRLAMVMTLVMASLSASIAKAEAITVFAAASLKDALESIAKAEGVEVRFSFAGSGTLARQVAAGAPADVVVLAHPDWMDWLETKTELTDRRDIAGNRLVLIGTPEMTPLSAVSAQTLLDLLGDGRLALGQTDSVPVGLYAKAWLTEIGAWEALRPRLAETDSVRAALVLVTRGESPLGIVYRSDLVAAPDITELFLIPSKAHAPIRYPAAALTAKGVAFTKSLSSPAAKAILTQHGFDPAYRAAE